MSFLQPTKRGKNTMVEILKYLLKAEATFIGTVVQLTYGP